MILHEEQVALTSHRETATERFATERCYGFEIVKDGTQHSQEQSIEQNKSRFALTLVTANGPDYYLPLLYDRSTGSVNFPPKMRPANSILGTQGIPIPLRSC